MRTSLKLIGTLLCLICHSCVVGAEASPSTSTDSDSDSAVVQEELKGDTSDQKLYDAIQNGEIVKVKAIINKIKDINQPLIAYSLGPPKGIDGEPLLLNPYTPLCLAVEYQHTEIVQFLLEQPSIDVNAGSLQTKKTPLHLAAKTGQLNLLIMLLNQPGIKKDKKTHLTNRTPLFLACEQGHLDCVMKLHEQGAHINHDADGITPLGAAEHYEHTAIVLFLEKKGAERGESAAIYKAIEKKNDARRQLKHEPKY